MVKDTLKPISPLNGYSRRFNENLLEEVLGIEIISLSTSDLNKEEIDKEIHDKFDLKLPLPGKSKVASDRNFRLMGLSIDQWLIMLTDEESGLESVLYKDLSKKVYSTMQTDAWVVVRISGPLALEALKRVCPVNLATDLFLKDDLARTMMEHMGGIIICEGKDSYLLMSASSSAKSFIHALETSLKNVT